MAFFQSPKINHDKTKVVFVDFSAVLIRYRIIAPTLNLARFIITYSERVKNL